MKEPDDDSTIDADLKSWLDGQDGVSAAYRQASTEQPPAALDARILAAARSAVDRAPPAYKRRWGGYRIAASFMLGALATSLWFNRPAAISNEEASVVLAQTRPAPADSLDPGIIAADLVNPQASAQQSVQQAGIQQERTREEGLQIARAQEATAQRTALQQASAENDIVASRRGAATFSAVPPPAVPLPAPALGQTPAAVRAELQEAGVTQLAEITLDGARIVDAEVQQPGYRATQAQWLDYLRSLERDVRTQAQAVAAATASLEQERALFEAAFPGVDLEAALQSGAEQR